MLALFGRDDHRLSKTLSLHVPSEVTPGPSDLLGLELEFSVRSRQGGRVHFGSLIHGLALEGSALDPGDPNAYRPSARSLASRASFRPGQTGEAALRRARDRAGWILSSLQRCDAREAQRPVCRLYAETFAADLMLLMDRADSPGLLVRPRPGRTELCGDFVTGQPLAAAAAFVAGTTRASAAAVRRRSARGQLPPRLDVRLARAVHRYGWYVDRSAFGTDLHAASRGALLPRASGGTISAQSHLELAWAAARQALADDAAAPDMQAAEAMVTGTLPLPAEDGPPGNSPPGQPGRGIGFTRGDSTRPKTPALRLSAHVRPGFTLHPVVATWDFTVFEASGRARTAYVCVPRDSLPGFIGEVEDGALDDTIAAYLAFGSRGRVLTAHEQTRHLGMYDGMGAPAGLLAPERDPQTGHRESGTRAAKPASARPGKRNRQEHSSPERESRLVRNAAAIGVAVVLAGGGAATAVALTGTGSGTTPASTPTTVAPTTAPPTTVAPITTPPTTVAPTTVAPTTTPPTTVAPTTVAPTTVAPTTVAPTTTPPTTVAPTTVAPTTVAPTTVAPTTVAPTTPVVIPVR